MIDIIKLKDLEPKKEKDDDKENKSIDNDE